MNLTGPLWASRIRAIGCMIGGIAIAIFNAHFTFSYLSQGIELYQAITVATVIEFIEGFLVSVLFDAASLRSMLSHFCGRGALSVGTVIVSRLLLAGVFVTVLYFNFFTTREQILFSNELMRSALALIFCVGTEVCLIVVKTEWERSSTGASQSRPGRSSRAAEPTAAYTSSNNDPFAGL